MVSSAGFRRRFFSPQEHPMSTSAQIAANQANAQLSTGPRTPEGKAASSANATREGFCARTPVVSPEQQPEFVAYRAGLEKSLQPQGALEDEFFQRVVTYGWNLRRVRAAEASLLATLDLLDELASPHLFRIARYRRDLERAYDHALAELRRWQDARSETPLLKTAKAVLRNEPNFRLSDDPLLALLPEKGRKRMGSKEMMQLLAHPPVLRP
jgi:hypothetical protein